MLDLFLSLPTRGWESKTYTREQWDIIWNTANDDSIRQGVSWIWDNIEWIWQASWDNQWDLLEFISTILNYFLWLCAFIALIYLLYHGFMMVTASWSQDKFEKWMSGIKYWTIALIGIWVSWYIISLIFHLVETTT